MTSPDRIIKDKFFAKAVIIYELCWFCFQSVGKNVNVFTFELKSCQYFL